jgi:hypothetical protein
MLNCDCLVRVFVRSLKRVGVRRTVVERQIRDVVIFFQLLQHLIRADFSALINRVKQFGFQPEYSHFLFFNREF